MENQKKRVSEMTPGEFEQALKAADARGPSPLTYVETREPYGSTRFYKGPSFTEFLANPPADVLEMISESDPTLKAKIRGDKVTSAAAAFMKACPEYLPTDANYEAVMRRMARTHLGQPFTTSDQAEDALVEAGCFTKENIVAAYKSLLALGQLEVKPGQVKVLSEAEKREVAVAIATDGEEIAVIQHLNFQLGTLPDVDSPRELLTRYATEASAAAFFVFAHTCSDFEDTPAWRAFLKSKLTSRYGVLTVGMLREFWNGFRFRNEGTFPVETTAADSTASGPDYSSMSSEQIAKLYEDRQRAARIDRARQVR